MRKLLLFVAILQAGCALPPKAGQPLVRSGSSSKSIEAPQDGVYELRQENEPGESITRSHLFIRESLGFQPIDPTVIHALAGTNPEQFHDHKRIPLAMGNYYWTLAKESELPWRDRMRVGIDGFAKSASDLAIGSLVIAGVTVLAAVALLGYLWLNSR